MDCREACRCPLGLCDRVTGRCLQLPFLQHAAARASDRGAPRAGELAGGRGGDRAPDGPGVPVTGGGGRGAVFGWAAAAVLEKVLLITWKMI